MDSYHGTSTRHAKDIVAKGVDVALGGGELGRGFYSGQHIYEAKAWAFQTTGDKADNVVKITTPDDDVMDLRLRMMNAGEAGLRRYHIRKAGETRTFLFGDDMIWAPIVGCEKVSGDQFKWETVDAESFLNEGAKTTKIVV